MRLSGIQKLTLLDFPETVSCILFTGGCNFRCSFCHNASLALNGNYPNISEEELFDFLKKRKGILDGVVITGGEPLIHNDIMELLEKIKELGYKIKLDTNGTNPKLLEEIVSSNLVDYVAMDIKNSPEQYGKTVGIQNFDISAVERSKNFLMQNTVQYEFRTTVVRGIHEKEDLISLAKWIKNAKKYYLQQFKNSGDLINEAGLSSFSEEEIKKFADYVRPFVPSVQVRGI